jgi:hypothetical protein
MDSACSPSRYQNCHAGLFEGVGYQSQRLGRVVDHEHDVPGLALTHEWYGPPATRMRIA